MAEGEKQTAFAVVELAQENNKEKVLTKTLLFSTREKGAAYLKKKYEEMVKKAENGVGLFSYQEPIDDYFAVIDADGDLVEAYLLDPLEIQ